MDIDQLVVQLASEDPKEVLAGVHRVAAESDRLNDSELSEVASVLCSVFAADVTERPEMAEVIEVASAVLVGLGPKIVPTLLWAMQAADVHEILRYARVLGRMGKSAIDPIMRFQATATEPWVRGAALYAISKIQDPAIASLIPDFCAALRDAHHSPRESAARALGKVVLRTAPNEVPKDHRDRMFDDLMHHVSDTHPGVRARVVSCLGKMAKFGYLDDVQRERVRKTMKSLLGQDEQFEWDRAFIVRREAQQALHVL
jgi:HEAT repeat protein